MSDVSQAAGPQGGDRAGLLRALACLDAAYAARTGGAEPVPETVSGVLAETVPADAVLITPEDEAWPGGCFELAEPPAALLARGDLSVLDRQLRVAVVGSRAADAAACEAAFEVAASLASRGALIVSGLAAGIDTAAHRGALSVRAPDGRPGRTAAVLGTPLSAPWPPENGELAALIAGTGLLLSDAPQAAGLTWSVEERMASLRARNRIVAALSVGTLVMAGKAGSSTLIELRHALALGRPVLLWKGIMESGEPWAQALLAENPTDARGRPLVRTIGSAEEAEAALSPWCDVWWL